MGFSENFIRYIPEKSFNYGIISTLIINKDSNISRNLKVERIWQYIYIIKKIIIFKEDITLNDNSNNKKESSISFMIF